MLLLPLTLPTPVENVACDEALLDAAEGGELPGELLRIWESPEPFIVIGRSSRREQEVNLQRAQQAGIPVIRRSSGGAAIVAGPGCLMYALVASYDRQPHLRAIDQAHAYVLGGITAALRPLIPEITLQGTSDLALNGRKVSGNSLRCKRTHFLYHGTLLYDFPLTRMAELLGTPPRQPDYRAGRDHTAFVANLPLDREAIVTALKQAFPSELPRQDIDMAQIPSLRERIAQLVEAQYATKKWNEEYP